MNPKEVREEIATCENILSAHYEPTADEMDFVFDFMKYRAPLLADLYDAAESLEVAWNTGRTLRDPLWMMAGKTREYHEARIALRNAPDPAYTLLAKPETHTEVSRDSADASRQPVKRRTEPQAGTESQSSGQSETGDQETARDKRDDPGAVRQTDRGPADRGRMARTDPKIRL